MSEYQEFFNMLFSDKLHNEYDQHFYKPNVVETAKKVYDAVDYLEKMQKDEAIASVLLARLWLENDEK